MISLSLFYSFILLTVVLIYLIFLLTTRFEKHKYTPLFLVISMLVLGISIAQLHDKSKYPQHYSHFVNNKPQVIIGELDKILKPTDIYDRFIVEVKSINLEKRLFGKLMVKLKKGEKHLELGSLLVFKTRLRAFSNPLNPMQFDYKRYMGLQDIYYQATPNKDYLKSIENKQPSVRRYIHDFKKRMIQKFLDSGLSNLSVSLLNALVFGNRALLSQEVVSAFSDAGVLHILALSGLHVGIITFILTFLLYPVTRLRNGKRIRLFLVVIFLWCFVLFTEMNPSILRAAIMFSLLIYAYHSKKITNSTNTLVISAIILLIINPNEIYNLGFQLSYVAVFSILNIGPILNLLIKPKHRIISYFWNLCRITLSAQIGVLPLLLYYFHSFPSLFLLSNLILLPPLALVLVMAFSTTALAHLGWLSDTLAWFVNIVFSTMTEIITSIAEKDDFVFRSIYFDAVYFILLTLCLIILLALVKKFRFEKLAFLGGLIIIFQLYFVYKYNHLPKDKLTVLSNYNRPLVIRQKKGSITIYSKQKDSLNRWEQNTIENYLINTLHRNNIRFENLKNAFSIEDNLVLVIDENGIYPKTLNTDILLMSHSPKINFERCLKSLKPKKVIIDNSNQLYLKRLWMKTLTKQNIPFFETSENGAVFIEQNAVTPTYY